MGLQKSRKRDVVAHQVMSAVRKDAVKYNPAYEILSVTLQPLMGQFNAQIYGAQITKMLLLLTNEPTSLLPEGAGVCVDVAIDAPPDYRVVSSKTWARHTVAHLDLVPEGARGTYGV
jgi:hypothetical protein